MYRKCGACPVVSFRKNVMAIKNIAVSNKTFPLGTTTGTCFGATVLDKLGFFAATPIVQPSGAAQAAASQTQTSLTDNTGGTPSTTLAVLPTLTDTPATADALRDDINTNLYPVLKNSISSLAAELALIKTDVAALVTLCNAQRTALVNLGLIKGAA